MESSSHGKKAIAPSPCAHLIFTKVIKYIDSQEMHHQKFTYEHEFITMLKKHGIPFDPNNVFGLICAAAYGARSYFSKSLPGLTRLG